MMPERKDNRIRVAGAALEGILEELCDRRQSVLLATPYFSIESRMMERRGPQLALRAPMSTEALRHALGSHPLRLRFPWDLTMFAGPISLAGFEQEDNRRTLLITAPDAISIDERRGAWRCEQVGRSRGALGSSRIIRVNLENLSATGACVFCVDAIAPDEFYSGSVLNIELSVDRGPQINTKARVCHGTGQTLGLAFVNMDPNLQDEIRAWIAPRRREAQRSWENRMETRAAAEAALKPKPAPKGLLLVSTDSLLADQVTRLTEDEHTLRVCAPALAPLKQTLEDPPYLVLLDITGATLDTRHRLKTMMDALALACPVVVIGSGLSSDVLRSFATDIKAAWSWEWNPNQGPFFQRLINGIIRRHWKAPESPAP